MKDVVKSELIAKGKAKSVFATNKPDLCIMEFRDDTSAFDGEKTKKLAGKGAVNNRFSAFIMEHLEANGIATHHVETIDDHHAVFKRLDMIPIECVVRNFATGSLCKRLGIEDGITLKPPLFEFFLKDDELHDPLITEDHILAFGWASEETIQQLRTLSLKVNEILYPLFEEKGFLLVDYKLEFGFQDGRIYLGDEFTPDGCRIWDAKTKEKLDKDRFRQDIGDVVEAYEYVAKKIGVIG